MEHHRNELINWAILAAQEEGQWGVGSVQCDLLKASPIYPFSLSATWTEVIGVA